LIGDEQAAALGFPNTFWKWLLPAIRPATWAIEIARRFSTRVQALAKVAGPKAFRHLLSERGLKGSAGEFAIPRRIALRADQSGSRINDEERQSAPERASEGGTR
jgi:hypothetical protein